MDVAALVVLRPPALRFTTFNSLSAPVGVTPSTRRAIPMLVGRTSVNTLFSSALRPLIVS